MAPVGVLVLVLVMDINRVVKTLYRWKRCGFYLCRDLNPIRSLRKLFKRQTMKSLEICDTYSDV